MLCRPTRAGRSRYAAQCTIHRPPRPKAAPEVKRSSPKNQGHRRRRARETGSRAGRCWAVRTSGRRVRGRDVVAAADRVDVRFAAGGEGAGDQHGAGRPATAPVAPAPDSPDPDRDDTRPGTPGSAPLLKARSTIAIVNLYEPQRGSPDPSAVQALVRPGTMLCLAWRWLTRP